MNFDALSGSKAGLRFVTYSRVSSEEQRDGYSLDEQDEIDRKFGESKKWILCGTYRDEGKSAKTTERPDFQRMMGDAENDGFDVIVVWNISRLTRSLTDMFVILRDLDKYGVRIVSVTEPFDFTTVIGRAILAVIVAFAEWFLQQLALDTARGHKARAEEGKWNSALPYGYYADYKKHGGDGLAIPDETERLGVMMAFETYATGAYGDAVVSKILNDSGFRPPIKRKGERWLSYWTKDSVRFMLQNRFYVGEVQYKGEWMPGIHEPLIPITLFEECQRIRAERHVERTKHSQKRNDRVYLLSGIVKCAGCGMNARAQAQQTRRKKKEGGETRYQLRYYTCHGGWKGHECEIKGKYIRADFVEGQIADYLKRLVLPPNWRERITAEIGKPIQNPRQSREQLEGELKSLQTLFRLRDITEKEYLSERERLKTQIARLNPSPPAPLTNAAEMLSDFPAIWEEATDEERRIIVQSFIEEVVAHPTEGVVKLSIKAEYQPLFNILDVR